jgi:hypothetical protein
MTPEEFSKRMQSVFVYCRNTAHNCSCFLLSGSQDEGCRGEKLNVLTGNLQNKNVNVTLQGATKVKMWDLMHELKYSSN